MKRSIVIICSILFINSCLSAQKYEPVTVKAGTNVKDYFPVSERYLYPDFTEGKGVFNKRGIIPLMFNFNLLTCEMEFIQTNDTMIITKKEEINSIIVAQDTFYYHDAYLQMIRSDQLKVFLKRGILVENILKQGAMGTVNRSAASESYSSWYSPQQIFDLKPTEDVLIRKTAAYFYSTSGNDYIQFSRKNIINILPGKENSIKKYIKSNKIDFESREDILKLADFVGNLFSENPKKS